MNRYLFASVSLLGFLALTAVAAAPVGIGPSFKGPVGLQLYSLRDEFAKNVPATLEKVHNYGFGYVELAGTYDLTPQKFKELLDANHLTPVAAHFGYERYRDDLPGVIRDVKALGLKYAGCAWIPHGAPFDKWTSCGSCIRARTR
jgi:hypothetical protein